MFEWILESFVSWIASIISQVYDAVSGLFLHALGTDMTAMYEYFPFVEKAFFVMQYVAWALLFLITVWQLFRSFGGPITEAENPWTLLARSMLFSLLIGYANPIFLLILDIARGPYTSLMDIPMTGEDFTFAGVEQMLKSGIMTIVSVTSIVGTLILVILMVALGWNYFKLLLETVERYIVVGVLCYTSPLAFCMGASKTTLPVFKSWCRMVGSQLLLLVMNVWFLRGFNSSMGHYIAYGGALSNGKGSVFLWTFCALAFLKTAQKFDSYLASMGLNVAQTGSSMGMEMMMAAKVVSGLGSGAKSAGIVFGGGTSPAGSVAKGFASGFVSQFKANSYVRDAVVEGGVAMGAGGSVGLIGRTFGGIAARNGAVLTGESISTVASRMPNVSGRIGGDIADRSLENYMPHLQGMTLSDTQITGGQITTRITSFEGKETEVSMYNTSQYEPPDVPYTVVSASDGSRWYQMASGSGSAFLYDTGRFQGTLQEIKKVAEVFPDTNAMLRSVGEGALEAVTPEGISMWYSSAFYEEPEAPHSQITASNGVKWYTMEKNGQIPAFELADKSSDYNREQFQQFMPGYEKNVSYIDGTNSMEGSFEVRHEDGSGTMFYDTSRFAAPGGSYETYQDAQDHKWYAVNGTASVERRPVYEDGKPVYTGDNVSTTSVASVRYGITPRKYAEPSETDCRQIKAPIRKR